MCKCELCGNDTDMTPAEWVNKLGELAEQYNQEFGISGGLVSIKINKIF